MKKIILLAAIAVFGFVNAQQDVPIAVSAINTDSFEKGWEKGDWLLSGSLNYSSSTQGEGKDNSFTFMPRIANFVTPNLAVGAEIGIMSAKSEFDGNTSSEWSSVMGGPFAYYFCTPENRFSTYTGLHLNYESINFKTDDYKENGFSAELSVGANYWFNDSWSANLSVGALSYSSMKPDFDDAESRNDFDLGFDMKNVMLGVNKRF